MTLKLSTFLLPTNQFALVAEFDPKSPLPHNPATAELLEQFGKRCGAVDVLIVNYPTRVEDAIVASATADRAEHDEPEVNAPDDWAEGGLIDGDVHVYVSPDQGDANLLQHILGWHFDFSPAGLVKLTDEEKATTAGELDERENFLAEQVEQLPGPIGSFDVLGKVDDVLPWTPQKGETVVVAVEGSVYGTTEFYDKPLLGQELSVVSSEPWIPEDGPAEGEEVVWLDTAPTEDGQLVLRVADILPLSAVDGVDS